ncbi:hypothetical protein F7725_023994 [Dissostichus mawsoni]|uniref:Uncharacterized protein n=1 Tax=Dissostichus mawsoni TaxID=36200 RepID=A0A7J5XYZ4_DISMA|nr:hypothetical protein F7725_023994 [Dissostichus mawsoni]
MPPRCFSFIRQRRAARVRAYNEAVCPCPTQCSKMLRSGRHSFSQDSGRFRSIAEREISLRMKL